MVCCVRSVILRIKVRLAADLGEDLAENLGKEDLGTEDLGKETKLPVNKVTWQQVGHVTEPGRYMFRFGWLTVAPDDIAIWTQHPDASFTLVQTSAPSNADETETADAPTTAADEFHLGAFELHDELHGNFMRPAGEGPVELQSPL